MKLFIISILFSLFISSTSFAQHPTTTEVFQKILRNAAPSPYKKSLSFLSNNKQVPSYLDELGFRSEIENLEPDAYHLEYMVRTKFNSKKERKARQRISAAAKAKLQFKERKLLLSQLGLINMDLVSLYFLQQENLLLSEKDVILQDKKIVYKNMADKLAKFDANKWLDNEEQIFEVNNKIKQNEFIINHIKQELQIKNINFGDWISLETLLKNIQERMSSHQYSFFENGYQIEREIAQAELEMEEAGSKKWFDFVQLKYQKDKKDPLINEFSIGTSFVIPLKSNNRVKKNEAYLDILQKETSAKRDRIEQENLVKDLHTSIQGFVADYESLASFTKSQKLQETYEAYEKINMVSPLQLLSLKSKMITYSERQLKIEYAIYKAYISLLSFSGSFAELPLINYLSESKMIIK